MNAMMDTNDLKILLADAQAVFRTGMISILQRHYPRAAFDEATTFRGAREKLLLRSWHLLVCDIKFADGSGFELIKEARRLARPVPSLAISAFPVQPYGCRAIACGAGAYLQREASAEELGAAARQLLAGHRFITGPVALALADAADNSTERPPHEILSEREMQVLVMLADGKGIKNIAADLSLSPKTVSTYRSRITEKLRLKSDAALVKYCLKQNLTVPFSDADNPLEPLQDCRPIPTSGPRRPAHNQDTSL